MPGIVGTVLTRYAETPSAITSAVGAAQRSVFVVGVEPNSIGARSSTPETPDTIMMTCCACCDPNQYTRMRLETTEPAIAPTALAAYTPPTNLPGSPPLRATAARASGKLAPQRIGPASTPQKPRTK